MSKAIITESHLTDIANAIIAKGGATEPLKPGEMAAAIAAIPSGGGPGTLLVGDNPDVVDASSFAGVMNFGANMFVNCNNPFTFVFGGTIIDVPLLCSNIIFGPARMIRIIAPNLVNIKVQAIRVKNATGGGQHGIQGVLSLPKLETTTTDWNYGSTGITEMQLPVLHTIPKWFCEENTSLRKIVVGELVSIDPDAFGYIGTGSNTVDVFVENTSSSLQSLGTVPFGGTNYMVFHCKGDKKKILHDGSSWIVVEDE